jgi:hypothetical protein
MERILLGDTPAARHFSSPDATLRPPSLDRRESGKRAANLIAHVAARLSGDTSRLTG